MEKENILGTERIGKLMLKFAVPSIIALLVNSLYNIVDQIFIGWGVGYLGNGATNIVFPLTVIALAFTFMIGDGAAAYFSLKLGEKKKDEAAKGVVNGIITALCVSLLMFVLFFIFLPNLLNAFGCTDALREYALSYGRIIIMGIPFLAIGTVLNGIIRSDGSPKYAMLSMVSGAAINTVLDPIFLFVLKQGVAGAAIATIISQIIVCVINVLYIKRLKSIKLTKKDITFDPKIALRVVSLGVSSFITQMSIVAVIAVQNNLLKKYGALSKFGADIPLTVLGIVMKVNQILNSIIIGISVGAQPIIGYNYGASMYDRVKKAFSLVLKICFCVGFIALVLFQTIPDKIIMIFGSGNELYNEFACLAFRRFLMLCICAAIQIPAGIFFQAIGKSTKSAILSLSRQIGFLIPSLFILSSIWGLDGLLFAGPCADALAFCVSIPLVVFELKTLGKKDIKSQTLIDDTSEDNILKNHVVITIEREFGSGGRYVGRLIADKLGIKLYDKDLVEKLVERTGYDEKYIESHEQSMSPLDLLNNGYYSGLSGADELFIQESELIKELAEKDSCVIIGRCSDYILKDRKNVLKVFVASSDEDKIKRATEIYGMDKDKALKEIERRDKARANHYKHYTGRTWNLASNYDICINSDLYGVEKAADIICEIAKNNY